MRFSLALFISFILIVTNSSNGQPVPTTKNGYKPVSTMLGPLSKRTDADKWFRDIKSWGVSRYFFFAPHYRGQQFRRIHDSAYKSDEKRQDFSSVALIHDMDTAFTKYIDRDEIRYQEEIIFNAYKAALKNGVDFYYSMPFPLFPVQKIQVVKSVKPELFKKDGTLDIYSPLMAEQLKNVIRKIKQKLPELKGVNIWLAEGCGEIYKFSDNDLIENKKWLYSLSKALDEVCRELKIEPVLFTHDYYHTVKTRRQVYETLAQFPGITIMEDITWPEENLSLPFWGSVQQKDLQLVKGHRIMTMFLTDTEYIGQGVWPGVYARWWSHNAKSLYERNLYGAIIRVYNWDRGFSDINFNRVNAHLLTMFLQNPALDPKQALANTCKEMFGQNFPNALVDILYETEPVIKEVTSINGISPLNHSGFPLARYVDQDYFYNPRHMKAVNDLFQPAGTILYPPLTDTLSAGKYWRYQLKLTSKPATEYLRSKQQSIDWLQKKLPEIDRLTTSLTPPHRKMFIDGYKQLLMLAEGMKIFIQAAEIHYQWYRQKAITREEAKLALRKLATELRLLVKDEQNDPVNLKQGMLDFAKAIETLNLERKAN